MERPEGVESALRGVKSGQDSAISQTDGLFVFFFTFGLQGSLNATLLKRLSLLLLFLKQYIYFLPLK